MIGLGEIPVKDGASIVESRNKIRLLAEGLKFGSISATRLATITSELIRKMIRSGQYSTINVELGRKNGAFGLILRFTSGQIASALSAETMESVFDSVKTYRTEDDLECIEMFKALPDPEFKPTKEFVTKEKEKIERLTRDELYVQLQGAYKKVKDQSDKLLLQSSQLIQTEKMSAVGTLVAGVAHELNNPMMGIINFTQYCLKHTSKDDKRYAVLQNTEREVKRCIAVVENLLTFSRMEKEGEDGFQKASCADILERVFKLLSYRIEKERVKVTKHYAKDTPEVWIRTNNIQQVFLNLVTNALDAVKDSDQKEINIDISQKRQFVQVAISDTGSGIAPENLDSIFDPFFTTRPVGQGTGLGFSISHSIIEAHVGKLTCESKPGEGARFKILLPMEPRKTKR